MIAQIAVAALAAASLTINGSDGWVCETLDKWPTEDGVTTVVYETLTRGYGAEEGAKLIVGAIQSQCPEYIPLLLTWAKNNG